MSLDNHTRNGFRCISPTSMWVERRSRRGATSRPFLQCGAKLLLVLLCALLNRPTAAQRREPARGSDVQNILLIIADDMDVSLSCYGHPLVKSPHIDRLAARGVRFERAYCNAPVCNPTRASVFSGQRPETIDVLDNRSPWPQRPVGVDFMPQHFQNAGFYTASIGKVCDHGHVPDQPFWDLEIREWGKFPPAEQILERGVFPTKPHRYWAQLKGPDEETADGGVARRAVQVMEQFAKSGQRFFLAVGFRRPHGPFAAPQEYFKMYRPEDVQLPAVPAGYEQSMLAIARNGETVQQPDNQLPSLLAYYACISFVDAQVGVLAAGLDRLDLWDDTVVVFVSDHGYHTGHHGMWHKRTLFEVCTRVPLIIAAPGRAPAVCRRVVEMVDIYPTLTKLTEVATPAALQGASLVPLLEQPNRVRTRPAFTTLARLDADGNRTVVGRTMRTNRYRYTEWDRGEAGVELYDHRVDPQEFANLAAEADYANVCRVLQRMLRSNKNP